MAERHSSEQGVILADDGLLSEPIEIQEEMERSFLEYAMSVIVARALPDVRDGLKPVHRRILFGMFGQGLRPDRAYMKCARVVGDVMGRYHPHGESAIYDALARMVQDFSLRLPLIDGHGNFGSTGPDEGPAAMRYTECRLAPLALVLLDGLDEDTVDYVANYDGTEEEPTVLPARFPNLLVNGSQGIAVGMATNIPPHNLGEVVDATTYLLANPDATNEELHAFVKGPDFPTGAFILGRSGIRDIYETGRGSIKMRAVAEIETTRTGSAHIVVTEFPYQTAVEVVESKIADLVRAGVLDGISRLQNASAGRKARLVIDLKRDANPQLVLNKLFKHTPMQVSIGVNMLALVDGVPRTLSLRDMLRHYLAHQVDVVTRRSRYRLGKARDRAHVLEGLLRAVELLDLVIATIREAQDRGTAREALMATPFSFTEVQANFILDTTLGRLTRIGEAEVTEELNQLRSTIAELELILSDETRLRSVIAKELQAVRDSHHDERRTRIVNDVGELSTEDLVADEELVITLTRAGYIKAVLASAFRTQGRGGRGVSGAKLREEDLVHSLVHTSAHSHVLLFSNRGRVYRLRGHEIPLKERTARGTAVVNLIPLASDEHINAMVDTREFNESDYLFFCTRSGQVKKTAMTEYDKSRRDGFIAISLTSGDELVRVIRTGGNGDVILFSRDGMIIRFSEADVRPMGRGAMGVRGMKLRGDDVVVSCDVLSEERDALVITDQGFAKRTATRHFGRQGRGGIGVRGIRLNQRRGVVAAAFLVSLDDEVLAVSSGGVAIRTAVRQIAAQGRDATGVRLMSLDPGQHLVAVTTVPTGSE